MVLLADERVAEVSSILSERGELGAGGVDRGGDGVEDGVGLRARGVVLASDFGEKERIGDRKTYVVLDGVNSKVHRVPRNIHSSTNGIRRNLVGSNR